MKSALIRMVGRSIRPLMLTVVPSGGDERCDSDIALGSLQKLGNICFELTCRFRRTTEVTLDKLLVGDMHGVPAEKWFRLTGDPSRDYTLLSESPYVAFLSEVDACPPILDDDHRIQKTSYYKMADLCRKRTGRYFDATTPKELCKWMRQYYRMYQTFDDKPETKPVHGFWHSQSDSYPVINGIAGFDLGEVDDGHHRLAIMLVGGHRHANVYIRRTKRTLAREKLLKVGRAQETSPSERNTGAENRHSSSGGKDDGRPLLSASCQQQELSI